MASSDSLNLAWNAVQDLNSLKRQLRGMATSGAKTLSKIDSLIENPDKLAILQDGLAGLNMNSTELNNEKKKLQTVIQYMLDNVDELTN